MDGKKSGTGFTVIELIVVMGIVVLISAGVGTAMFEGIKLWNFSQDKVKAQENAQDAMKNMVGEIREMIIADNGAYPLVSADSYSIVFYANIDSDTKREKVKYSVENNTLYRYVVEADDSQPPVYPDFTNNDRTIVARHIVNTDYVFQYYDNTYNGETSPLSPPFELKNVSLVKIKFLVDYDPDKSPDPLEVETNVSLRNLKYKYDN